MYYYTSFLKYLKPCHHKHETETLFTKNVVLIKGDFFPNNF